MVRKTFWKAAAVLVVLSMAIPFAEAGRTEEPTAIAPPAEAVPLRPVSSPADPPPPEPVSSEDALAKLHPALRELAQTAAPALPGMVTAQADVTVKIMVTAKPGTDLSAFMENLVPTRVLFEGEQDFYGRTQASRLIKIASLPDVISIIQVTDERDGPLPISPEDTPNRPDPKDWAGLRANADNLRAGSKPWSQSKAFGDGRFEMTPQDWFDIMPGGPHKAEAAWARGFDGEGVVTVVNDDGVDWGHPDLMGQQKIYSTTLTTGYGYCGPKGCAAAYNGWPMIYSPFSLDRYLDDAYLGASYISDGYPGLHYADTSETPTMTDCGVGVKCFDYTPLLDYGFWGTQHTYEIASTMSKSGIVHVGTHPDQNIRDFVWGEKVAVLVTDPNTAGVYDTVYVDLDDDYDFRDEKPLTRADTTNPTTLEATKNNMIAYRDMDGDGLADLSGGALYFIADGVTPIPHAWVKYYPFAAPAPGNGNLVAFGGPWYPGSSHGTLCASNVVGQGVVDGMVPSFNDLPGDGKPDGAVYGAGKNARLVEVSDIYWDFNNSKISAYTFAVYGYDGQRSTNSNGTVNANDTDGIQMTSNSYGSSDQDTDGWEYDGRYVSRRQRLYGNYVSMLFSTGNGAPAYGTTAPPSPDTAIGIGASTQYGSTGWDSITSTQQIMFNDMAWYSNRGPGARGTNGVDVVADGQRGAGDANLNYSAGIWGLDGNMAWETWGGTSRSAPAAMGNLALIYQAFKVKNGRWPSYDEAKAIFKSTSTDLNYDALTQGAGSVNADRGTAVAAGWYGLYVTPDEWNPGDYRGTDYPAFAHVMTPTQTAAETFTVHNTGIATITASIVDGNPVLIGSETFTYTVTPTMSAAKDPDNFFKAPQFVIPITATASKIISNSWWSNIAIPSDTELMVVTMRYPYDQFDTDGDYAEENRWRLYVYNWMDVDGDAKVWDDKNHNNVVNFVTGAAVTQIDGGQELDWDDPANELDRWEFGRFDYARPGGTVLQLPVRDPIGRMLDGLFIGLQQYDEYTLDQTDMTFEVDFYKYQNVPWLEASESSLEIAPGTSETFVVTATTNNTAPGIYEAAIKVVDPGGTVSGVVAVPGGTQVLSGETFPAHTSVIPVAMSVAPDYTEGMTFGGAAQAAAQANDPFNNAVVRGYMDWTWRAECGDWRFFFFDNKSTPPAGTKLIVKDEWSGTAPHTDIDTLIMGPTDDCFSNGGTTPACNALMDPAYYGPYTLDVKGKSPNTNIGAGIWRFDTSSGGAEDWVTAPFQEGLHSVVQHNVLFEGDEFGVVFTKTVGTVSALPTEIELYTYVDQGSTEVVVESGLALPGMVASAYGLGGPERFSWSVPFVAAGVIEYTYVFNVAHAAKIDITTSSPDISDIDIYLFRLVGSSWVQVASSAGPDANEHIVVSSPADGWYLLGVNNFSGPAGTVDAVFTIVQGTDLTVSGTTTNPLAANTPLTLTVAYSKTMNPGDTYQGSILLGPVPAPGALEIPVTIHRLSDGGKITKEANSAVVVAGDSITYTIQVQNTSQPGATFTVVDPVPANTTFITATNGAIQAGEVVTWTGTIVGDVTYEWRDSLGYRSPGTTLGAVTFDWEDIASLSTQLDVADGYDAEVDLPFAFKFDGVDYSAVHVSDDGLLSFVSYLDAFAIGSIPDAAVTEPFIGPFIVDLSPEFTPGTTGVWYKVLGSAPNRRAVFQWYAADWSAFEYVEFQAILYEGTNQIRFQYNDVSYAMYWGSTAMTGIQLDSTRGYDYGSTYAPRDLLALVYSPIYPHATFDVVVQTNADLMAHTVITNTATLEVQHVLAQAGQVEQFLANAYVTTLFVPTNWVYLPLVVKNY